MADKKVKIVAFVNADSTNFRSEMRKAEDSTKQSGSVMQGIFQGVGQQITRVFVDLAKTAFRTFLDGMKLVTSEIQESLKAAMEFSEGLSEVSTLGVDDIEGLRKGVLDLSSDLGLELNNSVKGLYQAISAGVPEDNVLDFLRVSGELATAGLTDLETAVDGLTSVINSYGLSFDRAREISDVMFTTVRLGKTRVEELARYLGRVTPIAAQMGVEFDEVSAILTSATRAGIRTRLAVTGLKAALSNILTPAEQTVRIFDEMGLSVADVNRLVREEGFIAFLQQLTPDQLKEVITSVEGLNTVLATIGQDGGKQFQKFLAEIQEGAGATKKAVGEVLSSSARQWKIMQSTIKVIRVEAIRPLEEFVGKILEILNEKLLKPIQDKVVPLLAQYLERLFTGPDAIAVLDKITDWSNWAVERLITDLNQALKGDIGFGDMIEGWINDGWVFLEPVLVDIGVKIIKVMIKSMTIALEQGLLTIARTFERLLPEIDWSRILAMPGEAGLMSLPGFHNGGMVPDLYGGGRDVIARLQPGEQVIPRGDVLNNNYGGVTINISGAGDPRKVAQEIKDIFRQDERLGRGYGKFNPEFKER